ncbi:Importin alpha subunit (Karyopherin alpha subunit) (Serine-rich RNA polymerase I suppressor protein) [Tulasnella sp. 417]|nr:Importin alpha subunit (Karyopherin alpha subunit) (Serine-rich RNA polymerase I suppressor protein) [Tulasnella sp. 417]
MDRTSQHTAQVVQAGAIPKLITLSASPSEDVSDTAVWALANIIGDSPNFRDLVEAERGIDALVRLLDHTGTTPRKVQGRAMWAIYNFIKPSPPNDLSVIRINHEDEATSEDGEDSTALAIQSLTWMLDRGLKQSDLIETGVVPRLVHLLADPSSSTAIQKRALRCIASLSDGNAGDIDALVKAGLLPALLVHLDAKKPEFCWRALWSASYIAAGSQSQVYALLDSGLLNSAARVLVDDQSALDCRRGACWMISKLSNKICVDMKILQAFADSRCIEGLSAALGIPDDTTRELAVSGITNVLKCQDSEGYQVGPSFAGIIRASSGPQNLRAIRDSRGSDADEEFRTRCHTLLARYFP